MKDKLSDKMFRAVTEYFTNGHNQYRALLAAGYTERTASDHPEQVFKHPAVVAEIARRQEAANAAANLDQAWITERLMTLADSSKTLAQYIKVGTHGQLRWDFTGATKKELQLIKSLTVEEFAEGRGDNVISIKKYKIDTSDPLAVLNSLARIAGLFNDRLQLEADDEVVAILQSARNRIKGGDE